MFSFIADVAAGVISGLAVWWVAWRYWKRTYGRPDGDDAPPLL